jgi:hypothetical protein
MLIFWILLFIAAFLGTIALIFYLTIEVSEIDKEVNTLLDTVKNDYAVPPDAGKKKK